MAHEIAHEDRGSSRRRGRRRHPVRRAVAVLVGVLLLVLLGAAAWLAVDAVTVRDELTTAADLVETLQDEVRAGDAESARSTLVELQDHASAAHEASHGPHWSLAGVLPWAGPNVRAVQEVSEVVVDLSDDVLPGVIEATGLVDPAALARGEIPADIAALQSAAGAVIAADVAVQAAAQRLAAIDRAELVAAVAAPVDELEAKVQEVATATESAAQAARLLPTLLGAA